MHNQPSLPFVDRALQSVTILKAGEWISLFNIVGKVQESSRGYSFGSLHLHEDADKVWLEPGEYAPDGPDSFERLLAGVRQSFPGVPFQALQLCWNQGVIRIKCDPEPILWRPSSHPPGAGEI